MTRVLFVGVHAAAAAALSERQGHDAAFDGPPPPDAIAEALEEIGVDMPRRATAGPDDRVVDTGDWNLPEPVGLCLEEARELRADIERRVADLAAEGGDLLPGADGFADGASST